MSPLVGLGSARSFCLPHPLFRIDTEDQPHRHLVAICQLQNYTRYLSRIAFQTPFEASQRGAQPGYEVEDWLQAERELTT